jgi:hypothetical protein
MTELELFERCVIMAKNGQRSILFRDDAILAVDAELTALREKYSTVCYVCGGSGQCCTNSNCTNGRIPMLDAAD